MNDQKTQAIVSAHNLRRTFKQTTAVAGLDLEINAGELFGLVGPDGAGKTTTLQLLAGLLSISAGEAQIAGYDLRSQSEAIKPKIGYMAQEFSLYAELSVVENLRFFASLFDVPDSELKSRIDRLLDFAGLNQFRQRRAAHLSGGMQKKLALACTLLHEPPILLLDEPTTGVDPISRREFWEILNELHLNKVTIIISTPYMDEADRCSRVGLMYAGHLMVCSTPRAIRQQINAEVLELIPDDPLQAGAILLELEGVSEVQTYGNSLHVLVDNARRRIQGD